LWNLKTGLPSGWGTASGNVYYLPLKESMDAKKTEICAIDMHKGRIVSHLKPPDEAVPGNLLFFQDEMISLTPWEITAYPLLRAKISKIDERLAQNPADPTALTERATLRLDKGDLAGAIEDLRKALKNKPDPDTRQRARLLFFESLMDLFQRDLRDADKLLKEYEELCNMDQRAAQTEQRRQRMELALLIARLREKQGRPIEALNAYLDLATERPSDELVPLPGERTLKVRRDVWLRGRIEELLKKATPEQRKQLEEEMARRLKDAQDRARPR
jgi:tetratricopeptide (TPR) repeat protein